LNGSGDDDVVDDDERERESWDYPDEDWEP
jgi:hypothetical protein